MKALPALFVVFTLASLFLFPYPYTAFLSFLASLYFPWFSLVVGVFADVLFFTPLPARGSGLSLPVASLVGIFLSALAVFVRRFVKTRIIT